ncbi:uncharacterized protein LOC123916561 [Trifolium pratense]|uniref:uncharacterized protein LOC123916561 n=1 Tax=Trifolium pratense TaxID=57577 RepID=UPI001E691BE1|nr:uncharacterized protein LOC123916561 [Trifolium pratense]
MNPDEENFDDDNVDDDIDDIPPAPGVGRGRAPRRRRLPRRVVRNRWLEGMPKSRTVDGVEEEYDSYDDDDDHEDEEIADIALLAPQNELLVDRHGRPIIMPYTATDLQPQNPANKAINNALKSKFQAPYLNWTEVRADERGYQQFWNGFRSQVTWLNHHTAAIERIFNKKATKRLSTLLFEARKKIKKDPSKPPLWLAGNSYPMLCRRWEEEEYIAKCIKNKANRNTDEANRACVHSGGSKSAGTLRLEFIQQFGRPPTFMEMNDMMHRYADSGQWTGARAQEVSRLTQIWVEEYNASQLRLPPHRRDNEDVRRNKMSLAFVKNAGGATRGRKFAAGCTSSLYASDPTGLRDVTYTSSSSSSTGRSRPTQREETDDEYEARMRATYREEFRDEFEASFDDRVDLRVQHILQEFFAQQRAPAGGGGAVKGQDDICKSWGRVVRRCMHFLKENPRLDIRWVQRKANQAAHEMAKWAKIEPYKKWTTNIPYCVWLVIQKDKGSVISIQVE